MYLMLKKPRQNSIRFVGASFSFSEVFPDQSNDAFIIGKIMLNELIPSNKPIDHHSAQPSPFRKPLLAAG
ncbi:hypothetical protein [Peribacillus simplex]|uniref:hypothetical protein n=1 Tax=Peribacillus simplex TaxID=1478 RepID=UPI00366C36B0